MAADGGEVAAVLGGVLEGSETSHGESGDGASLALRDGAEVRVHPRDELLDVEGFPLLRSGVDFTGSQYQPAAPPSGMTMMRSSEPARLRMSSSLSNFEKFSEGPWSR